MTYFEKLHPWCVIRPLPNLQRLVVARCRRRSDAESLVQVVGRLVPSVPYTIVFDPMPEPEDNIKISDRSVPEEI